MPEPVDVVVELLEGRDPACGQTVVVAIDGPSGAGKSELAAALVDRAGGLLLKTDAFVPGWRGLEQLPPILAQDLLAPLAAGSAARPVRWDWDRDGPGEPLVVEPATLLVLDGCGSGSRVVRPFLSLLVWIDGPEELRHARAMARDGDAYEPWWDVWAAQERRLFPTEGTAEAADVRFTASP